MQGVIVSSTNFLDNFKDTEEIINCKSIVKWHHLTKLKILMSYLEEACNLSSQRMKFQHQEALYSGHSILI